MPYRLPLEGLVRLKSILGPIGPIPVGKSTWWEGVATGKFPKPVKLAARVTAWRVEDIRALMQRPDQGDGAPADEIPVKPRSTKE
jgi:predicted DNA-binding transcriptional regulator AlpA